MNLMFFGDIHLLSKDLPEIEEIFSELLILKDKYCINKIIITGDSFDSIKPNSQELDCFSIFLKKLNIPIILLAATSHESTTPEDSIINHFGLLNDKIFVCKEYKDENKLYVGHFILKQSSKNYGGTVDINSLKQFRFVILGHGHNHEIINNYCQLGSIRYVDFGEDPDIKKKVAICLNYETEQPRWIFLTLNSPYPMISLELNKNEIFTVQNESNNPKSTKIAPISPLILTQFDSILLILAKLDQLSANTKIRIIFKDYGLWREFLSFSEKYKNKFFLFKERKDFVLNLKTNHSQNVNNYSIKESLIKWMEQNKIPEEIKKILMEEIK